MPRSLTRRVTYRWSPKTRAKAGQLAETGIPVKVKLVDLFYMKTSQGNELHLVVEPEESFLLEKPSEAT